MSQPVDHPMVVSEFATPDFTPAGYRCSLVPIVPRKSNSVCSKCDLLLNLARFLPFTLLILDLAKISEVKVGVSVEGGTKCLI